MQTEAYVGTGTTRRVYLALHSLHQGRGVFRTKEATYELKAGQGFVIMPEMLVHYNAHEADPWVYSWIGFRGVNARPLLQRAGIDMEHPVFEVPGGSYLENFYSQKISVLEIARSVGLDRTYLSGLFKERFGVSLQAFLLEYRMNRAAELLQNPELSISDISRSVSYTDPFLFSKMFKKFTGLAPSAFRNKS